MNDFLAEAVAAGTVIVRERDTYQEALEAIVRLRRSPDPDPVFDLAEAALQHGARLHST